MSLRLDPTLRVLLTGLHAGDSLGSTSEFVAPRDIPAVMREHEAHGWPHWQVGGGTFGWESGDPTDDTDMALCLVRAHVRHRRTQPESQDAFDPHDVFGRRAEPPGEDA